MNTIFKKFYLSIPFTILISLALYSIFPLFNTLELSKLLLNIFPMNISLAISAILLFLFYYLKYKIKNTSLILSEIILSLFSLSLGLVFLNILQISLINRILLWIIPLIIISYYFRSFIVNIVSTLVLVFILSSYIFYMFPMYSLELQSIPFVGLTSLATAIILVFISNIPVISKNYPLFSSTYKVFSLFIVLQNLLIIFINTAFDLSSNYMKNSLIPPNNNTSLLLLLSIIPTTLALLSFSSYFLNKNRASSYLKVEICLSILASIVMIFILNFPATIISLIISGLCFILISTIFYYLSYYLKNPFLLILMNTITLFCILHLIVVFKISGLPIIIPIVSYIVLSILLNLPLKRLTA